MGCNNSNWAFNNFFGKLRRWSFDYQTLFFSPQPCFSFSQRTSLSAPRIFNFPVKRNTFCPWNWKRSIARIVLVWFHLQRDNEADRLWGKSKSGQLLLFKSQRREKATQKFYSNNPTQHGETTCAFRVLTQFRCERRQIQVAVLVLMVVVSCGEKKIPRVHFNMSGSSDEKRIRRLIRQLLRLDAEGSVRSNQPNKKQIFSLDLDGFQDITTLFLLKLQQLTCLIRNSNTMCKCNNCFVSIQANYVTTAPEGCPNPNAPSFPSFWRMHRYYRLWPNK